MKAVLADGELGDCGGHFRNLSVRTLGRFRSPFDGVLDAGPRFGLDGRHESIPASRGGSVRDSAEGVDLVLLDHAADLAGSGVGDGPLRTVLGTCGDSLIQ